MVGLVALTVAYFAVYGVRTTRPESLRRLVTQNVRIGASADEVVRFLDSQRLEHSGLARMPEFSTLHRTYGDSLLVVAIKRYTMQAWWGFESIQIIFIFDDSGHLIKFDLHPQYTAL